MILPVNHALGQKKISTPQNHITYSQLTDPPCDPILIFKEYDILILSQTFFDWLLSSEKDFNSFRKALAKHLKPELIIVLINAG